MKRFLKLKLILPFLPLFIVASAIVGPLASSLSNSFAAAATRGATRSTSGGQVVSTTISPQTAAATLAYWTPTRMQSALPADLLLAPASLTHPAVVQGRSSGPSGVGAPALPTGPSASTGQPFGVAPDATLVPHYKYKTFPYSTVGKVFGTDPKTGQDFVCSGAAVNSSNLSVVDTAGHCIVEGGSGNDWFTHWMFCPQYYKGTTPYGCWTARALVSIGAWVNSGSLEDDFGDAVVSPNRHGKIVNVVGGTGWAYGLSTSRTFTALGYPAASPFNGQLMYQCGPTKPSKVVSLDDGRVVVIPCNMTPGSSGGPWLISLNGTFGYVNGHNDFRPTNDLSHMYSPYYDSDWYTVFNTAQQL